MSGVSRRPKQTIKPDLFSSGILVDPLTELMQPGGPFPPGYVLLTDGMGGFVIAPPSLGTVVRRYTGNVNVGNVVAQRGEFVNLALGTDDSRIVVGIVERVDFPSRGLCTVRHSGDATCFEGLEPGSIYGVHKEPGKLVKITTSPTAKTRVSCGVSVGGTTLMVRIS